MALGSRYAHATMMETITMRACRNFLLKFFVRPSLIRSLLSLDRVQDVRHVPHDAAGIIDAQRGLFAASPRIHELQLAQDY